MDVKKARETLRNGKTIYDMNLRVGYYARVSTDKEDQLNSLENQQKYFEEVIQENKNWSLTRGYIDEGISGTQVKKRDSFLKMIEDATLGKIDLILTKEISRFSRNTIDSIKYTEYLLKKGVIVYFLSDNLNTLQEDAEFRLTIMSSLAQDEVRKLSERVKFGVNRMIKDGKLIGGNLTGYYKKNGRYEINPKESPLIKYLFTAYASGNNSLKKIGEELAKQGYLNSKGEPYSSTSLAKFLTNPRYKGYYTARLTEVEDYKTHKKRKVPKDKQIIYKDDKIPAIVSEKLWEKANSLYEKRKRQPSRHILNQEEHQKKYKYSCKLYCKDCGKVFIRNGGSNRSNNPIWVCRTYKVDGVSKCASPLIKESTLDEIFIPLFSSFLKKKQLQVKEILKEYENIIEKNQEVWNFEEIKDKITSLKKQKEKLLDLSIKGFLDDFDFKEKKDKLNEEIKKFENLLKNPLATKSEKKKWQIKMDTLEKSLKKKINIKENLPYLISLLISRVEVEKRNRNRKQIRLRIIYDFHTTDKFIDLNLDRNHPRNELPNSLL